MATRWGEAESGPSGQSGRGWMERQALLANCAASVLDDVKKEQPGMAKAGFFARIISSTHGWRDRLSAIKEWWREWGSDLELPALDPSYDRVPETERRVAELERRLAEIEDKMLPDNQ